MIVHIICGLKSTNVTVIETRLMFECDTKGFAMHVTVMAAINGQAIELLINGESLSHCTWVVRASS